jgi:hypothetical protein
MVEGQFWKVHNKEIPLFAIDCGRIHFTGCAIVGSSNDMHN